MHIACEATAGYERAMAPVLLEPHPEARGVEIATADVRDNSGTWMVAPVSSVASRSRATARETISS